VKPFVLIWGGGDLASGVAIRLHRVGIRVLIVEAAQPMAVRLSVSFARAVYDREIMIEDVRGQLIHSPDEMQTCWDSRDIPVLVDPELNLMDGYPPISVGRCPYEKSGDCFRL
jgi:xanthine dehydrogenase accessory factor